jgi:DNA-3-methyladenine glycosylase
MTPPVATARERRPARPVGRPDPDAAALEARLAGTRLKRAFFDRSSPVVARALLGRLLVHDAPDGRRAGVIVEVEAYAGERDPASHAYRGPTPRNAVMYEAPGHLYVYFTYGMHHCMNLVCGPGRTPAAVLIRALEPQFGLEAMMRARGVADRDRVARGPGCVTQALGLDRRHEGLDLVRGPVWVADTPAARGGYAVARSARIGIAAGLDRHWRFFLAGHPCVSGPRFRVDT